GRQRREQNFRLTRCQTRSVCELAWPETPTNERTQREMLYLRGGLAGDLHAVPGCSKNRGAVGTRRASTECMAHGTTELIRQGEKEWHEKLFASRASRPLIVPPAIRARYLNPPKRPLFEREHLFHLAGDVRGKRVLVFGCGDE